MVGPRGRKLALVAQDQRSRTGWAARGPARCRFGGTTDSVTGGWPPQRPRPEQLTAAGSGGPSAARGTPEARLPRHPASAEVRSGADSSRTAQCRLSGTADNAAGGWPPAARAGSRRRSVSKGCQTRRERWKPGPRVAPPQRRSRAGGTADGRRGAGLVEQPTAQPVVGRANGHGRRS